MKKFNKNQWIATGFYFFATSILTIGYFVRRSESEYQPISQYGRSSIGYVYLDDLGNSVQVPSMYKETNCIKGNSSIAENILYTKSEDKDKNLNVLTLKAGLTTCERGSMKTGFCGVEYDSETGEFIRDCYTENSCKSQSKTSTCWLTKKTMSNYFTESELEELDSARNNENIQIIALLICVFIVYVITLRTLAKDAKLLTNNGNIELTDV